MKENNLQCHLRSNSLERGMFVEDTGRKHYTVEEYKKKRNNLDMDFNNRKRELEDEYKEKKIDLEYEYKGKFKKLEKENNHLHKIIDKFYDTVEKFIDWVCHKFGIGESKQLINDFEKQTNTFIDPVKQLYF